MNILHIASFKGNIGDNISHIGLYRLLQKLGISLTNIQKIEIRKAYNNYTHKDKLSFDENLVKQINKFDLCLIGGGGFINYDLDNSPSGATISIDPNLICKIQTPLLMTSLGVGNKTQTNAKNIEKFKHFLNEILNNTKIKLCIRNDGSLERIAKDIGLKYAKNFCEVLDNGFFFSLQDKFQRLVNEKYMVLNIHELKNSGGMFIETDSKNFDTQIVKVLEYCIKHLKLHIVFVPHVWTELWDFYRIISLLDDKYRRNNISIAPLLQGEFGACYEAFIYKYAKFVIAARFHSNIVSIVLNKKVIALNQTTRISGLYESLNMKQYCVSLQGNFSESIIENIEKLKQQYCKITLQKMREKTLQTYKEFFDLHFT